MTAQLIQGRPAAFPLAPVRPSRAPGRRLGPAAPKAPAHTRATRPAWVAAGVHSCSVQRPAGLEPVLPVGDGRLCWTRRGLAVMVLLVVALVLVMGGTAAWAFLAVSNEPVEVAHPMVLQLSALVGPR